MNSYEVRHRTLYSYKGHVTSSYGRAHLLPRDTDDQVCRESRLTVQPTADVLAEHTDFYGNRAVYLEVHTPHRQLLVESVSIVDVTRDPVDLTALGRRAWDDPATPAAWQDLDFTLPSPLAPLTSRVARYAESIFTRHRPLAEAVPALVHDIYDSFAYAPGATDVTSTLDNLFERREGVCQDFAHLAVACLRHAGLPARYVSGYLETVPPEGREKLQGADASHAWCAVLLPELGWVHLDPTNDRFADSTYIVTAWGRDYTDVPPFKGVVFSQSTTSTLSVAVDVRAYQPPTRPDLAPA